MLRWHPLAWAILRRRIRENKNEVRIVLGKLSTRLARA